VLLLRRVVAGAALLAVAAPPPALAQRYWKTSYVPYAYYRTVDGFWLAGYATVYSPVGFAEQPEPHRAWAWLRAGLSTEGSYGVYGGVQAPAWWDGWRAHVTLLARRDNRLPYFGIGNGTGFDKDSVTPARPYFYGTSRSARSARLIIQRRVVGPVRVLAMTALEHTDFRELPGESLFRRDHGSGAVDSSTVPFADAVLGAGLVFDTRDREVDPRRGVLAELLYADGRGYARTTGSARVWLAPLPRLALAARAAGERMTGAPPLAAQQTIESSDGPFPAVGGLRSLRGYADARFTGAGKLLATLEVRYALVSMPTIFELQVGAVCDVGRVFGPGERFRVTTDGLHAGWGAELAAHVMRNSVFLVGGGLGKDGWQLWVDTKRAF
jgi:hypothetical protein